MYLHKVALDLSPLRDLFKLISLYKLLLPLCTRAIVYLQLFSYILLHGGLNNCEAVKLYDNKVFGLESRVRRVPAGSGRVEDAGDAALSS